MLGLPDLWSAVLDGLAELTDSRGGLLFSIRGRVLNWTASENLRDIFRVYGRPHEAGLQQRRTEVLIA